MPALKIRHKVEVIMKKTRTGNKYYDYSLKFIIYFLLIFGLIILYSTSSYNGRLKTGDPAFYLKRQMLNTMLGVIGMEIISRIDYRRWKPFAIYAYAASIIMTLLVQFTPLGVEQNGARRWLGYGSFSFQPAEVAKIGQKVTVRVKQVDRQRSRIALTMKGVKQ